VALFKLVFSRRYLSIVALIVTYSLFSFAISQAADAPGTKGPIGTTEKLRQVLLVQLKEQLLQS
jgi:hypothetical protein